MTTQQDNPKPAARVGHKKSRTGCFKCRSRRVKCDEAAPICANCQRLGLQCQYPNKPKSSAKVSDTTSNTSFSKVSIIEQTTRSSSSSTSLSTPFSTPRSSSGSNGIEHEKNIPSITKGNHMELRLLHAFMSKTMPDDNTIVTSAEWRRMWFIEMPRIALDHDNLLYALLAFTALVFGSVSGSSEMSFAQGEYFTLALQQQQAALSNPDRDIEATTLAAILIAQSAFGMLRGRPLQPYVPPADWFEVSRGAWHVSPRAEDIPPGFPVLRFVIETTAPVWKKWTREPDSHVDEIYTPILTHLVSEEFDCYGGDAEKGLKIYEKVLSLLTEFRQGVATQGEPVQNNVWRVCIIPQTVPDDFVRFLRQGRPRALLITASIFAVISRTKVLKVFGDSDSSIPRSEIQAIQRVLPHEWQELMVQPLEELASSVG